MSEFIIARKESILANWESFAATREPAARQMDSQALRDHAGQILRAIAADIATPQSEEQQRAKSRGNAPTPPVATRTAAQTHAVLRARSGFDINQLVSEYRALRASVLRLWFDSLDHDQPDVDEVVRFNEAVDQAIAESVAFFNAAVERSRNLLLGMLGHDMRSPLQTIQMTARYLAALDIDQRVDAASARLVDSGARIQSLLDDLEDFNRTRLGLGINVRPAPVDLRAHFAQEIEQVAGAHPGRRVTMTVDGDTCGEWDAMRLRQLLGNLLVNALRHGAQDGEVQVSLAGGPEAMRVQVSNRGAELDPATIERMFEPLAQAQTHPESADRGHSLGLGLYIAREVARAHGGDIRADSQAGQTCFTVTLPRAPTND